MKKHVVILAFIALLITSCADNEGTSNTQPTEAEHAQHVQEATAQMDDNNTLEPQAETAKTDSAAAADQTTYTLDATVHKGDDGYVLEVQTNLKLSEDHYNMTPVEGEGHIHYYLNDALVGPIKNKEPLTLSGLLSGSNTIRLVLATNNHGESYNAEKTITFDND